MLNKHYGVHMTTHVLYHRSILPTLFSSRAYLWKIEKMEVNCPELKNFTHSDENIRPGAGKTWGWRDRSAVASLPEDLSWIGSTQVAHGPL